MSGFDYKAYKQLHRNANNISPVWHSIAGTGYLVIASGRQSVFLLSLKDVLKVLENKQETKGKR